MPGGDRTGPLGQGPRTGRGLGYCTGNEQPGYTSSPPYGWWGRGFRGQRPGFGGHGRRNRFYDTGRYQWERGAYPVPAVPQGEDIESLKAQAQELQEALQKIQTRLDEIES